MAQGLGDAWAAYQQFDGGNEVLPFTHAPTPVLFPFWAIINPYITPAARLDDVATPNSIYYRLMSLADIPYEPRLAPTFARVTADVGAFYPGDGAFTPLSVLVATWYRVVGNTGASTTRDNTFQLVLASDSQRTYVIYLYAAMGWDAFPQANNFYGAGAPGFAQAGLDWGDRSHLITLPGSGTPQVTVALTTQSNVGVPGVWAFRIDGSSVIPPCGVSSPNAQVEFMYPTMTLICVMLCPTPRRYRQPAVPCSLAPPSPFAGRALTPTPPCCASSAWASAPLATRRSCRPAAPPSRRCPPRAPRPCLARPAPRRCSFRAITAPRGSQRVRDCHDCNIYVILCNYNSVYTMNVAGTYTFISPDVVDVSIATVNVLSCNTGNTVRTQLY